MVLEWREGGGGSKGWVGGLLKADRERQEAGQRQTSSREEERGSQSSGVSISFVSPGSAAACFLPVQFPSRNDWTVWRENDWWTAKWNRGVITCEQYTALGDWDCSALQRTPTDPRITEEWSSSGGKLTHGTVVEQHRYWCADSEATWGTVKSTPSARGKHTACCWAHGSRFSRADCF